MNDTKPTIPELTSTIMLGIAQSLSFYSQAIDADLRGAITESYSERIECMNAAKAWLVKVLYAREHHRSN